VRSAPWLWVLAIAAIELLEPTSAFADDLTKEQCVAASENAQTLRQRGKLRAARAEFLVCNSKSCPGPVREDCAEQLRATERMMPTLEFVVRDDSGRDVRDVEVTMDGSRLADRLDGSGVVAVDPGEHTFRFTAAEFEPLERRLVVRARAERTREVITLHAPSTEGFSRIADTPSPGGRAEEAAARETPTASPGWLGRNQVTAGYVMGATAVAALGLGSYFGLRAKSTYDDATSPSKCPGGLSGCTQAGVDGVATANSEATVATVAFVAGLALLGTGIFLLATAPDDHAGRRDGTPGWKRSSGTRSAGALGPSLRALILGQGSWQF
jgi:hypothetical protein